MNKLLKVQCPQCALTFSYYESEFRPFCCERCKMIDLGHWFEESYRVPEKEIAKTEKINNEESKETNDHEEDSYDDYTAIDEDSYDENDY